MPVNLSQEYPKLLSEKQIAEYQLHLRNELLRSILENAVHIGGTDYRIDEKSIDKIKEVLK